MPRPFYPQGKIPSLPTEYEARWTQRRSERGDEQKKPYPCREWDPGRPARRLVTILTELPVFVI